MTSAAVRQLAWPTGALVVSVAGAVGVGEITVRAVASSFEVTPRPGEPVRFVAEAAFALGVAGAVAVLAALTTAASLWLVGLAWGARRSFPPGKRAVPVLITGVSGVLSVAVASGVAVAGHVELAAAAAVVLCAAAGMVYPWWGSRVGHPPQPGSATGW